MKVGPTLEGGLRIDAEDLSDWEILHAILHDAKRTENDLADSLGGLILEEAGAEDWRDFVVPDLRDEFDSQLSKVTKIIEGAMEKSGGDPGSIWIGKADGFIWYGALNQARLALEDLHHFGPSEDVSMEELHPARRSAYFRSQFYLAIQSLLLDHVMR
jgi:hypothetical protein